MKKVFLKVAVGVLSIMGLAFNMTIEKSNDSSFLKIGIAESYGSDCPNGCLTTLGTCVCNGQTHAWEEKDWGDS